MRDLAQSTLSLHPSMHSTSPILFVFGPYPIVALYLVKNMSLKQLAQMSAGEEQPQHHNVCLRFQSQQKHPWDSPNHSRATSLDMATMDGCVCVSLYFHLIARTGHDFLDQRWQFDTSAHSTAVLMPFFFG